MCPTLTTSHLPTMTYEADDSRDTILSKTTDSADAHRLLFLKFPMAAFWGCHVLIAKIGTEYNFLKHRRTEEGQSNGESERKMSTDVHTPVGMAYWMVPGTAVCLKESTEQHDTASQGKARHRTAPHGAALPSHIAGLS